jgi:hypothetical protein
MTKEYTISAYCFVPKRWEKNLVVLIDDVESFREPVTFTGGG